MLGKFSLAVRPEKVRHVEGTRQREQGVQRLAVFRKRKMARAAELQQTKGKVEYKRTQIFNHKGP